MKKKAVLSCGVISAKGDLKGGLRYIRHLALILSRKKERKKAKMIADDDKIGADDWCHRCNPPLPIPSSYK